MKAPLPGYDPPGVINVSTTVVRELVHFMLA